MRCTDGGDTNMYVCVPVQTSHCTWVSSPSMNGTGFRAESMKYTEHHKGVNVTQLKTVLKIESMR
jgi:hypothetical protein